MAAQAAIHANIRKLYWTFLVTRRGVLTCVDGRLRGHDGGRSVGVPSFSENELLSTPSRATLMPVGRREAPLPTLF
jgi:hypothetical protein